MPRMAGLLIGIMYEEASPTDTLQLLLSLPPRQVSIRSFHRGCQEAQQDSWQANLHIPYAFLLRSASAMGLFFFYLVIIFYTGTVRPLYKMIPHGSAHGILPTSW